MSYQIPQPPIVQGPQSAPNAPPEYQDHQFDALDEEMLAETHEGAQHTQPANDSHEEEDAEFEKSLAWIPQTGGEPFERPKSLLPAPVVIPQIAPGIKPPFARAYSPFLASHSVYKNEFLQFIDHLNVCKTASPPLQLLNLAGTIVGFTPVPFAFAIGMGTNAAAIGGMVAVARIRITRYLERVNKEYFVPRGLQARIAKQKSLPQIIGQAPNAPLLAPLPLMMGPTPFPSLRDRRMQALGNLIAPIQYESSAEVSNEGNVLDKMSAKITARSAEKSEAKINKHHAKAIKHVRKDEEKTEKKLQKAVAKGKHDKIAKLEAERAEIYADIQGTNPGSSSKGSEKEEKAAQKFMFVVIQNLQEPSAQ